MKSKRKARYITTFISFVLFPVILNFLSPYVSVSAAMSGIVSGSVMVFIALFVLGFFFGRGFCSYVCPWSAPSDFLRVVNDKRVDRKKLSIIRYSIFGTWLLVLVSGFILAGGIKGVDPLYLTETGVSVDEPWKYITYYFVIALLFIITILVGRRGACQTLCWMSPFMVLGMILGDKVKFLRWKVHAQKERCIQCNQCNQVCPMSIDVVSQLQSGTIDSYDCILCHQCVEVCPRSVLSIQRKKKV
ncbi:MAG: 4Fe-4S binding protein [Candidatus Izemoplasmatales bacterium]